jgi:hypothetical protein
MEITQISDITYFNDSFKSQETDGSLMHKLPVEIWIEIFSHMTDADKWHLAQTCTWVFSIFQKWCFFDWAVVLHVNDLYCLQSDCFSLTPLTQTTKSNHFQAPA